MTMKIIKTNNNEFAAHFSCVSEDTRYGFRHMCRLDYYDLQNLNDDTKDGNAYSKICYYNRTWENYQFRTVMRKAVRKAMEKRKEIIRAEMLKEFNVKTLNNRGYLFRERCSQDDVIKSLCEVFNKL